MPFMSNPQIALKTMLLLILIVNVVRACIHGNIIPLYVGEFSSEAVVTQATLKEDSFDS